MRKHPISIHRDATALEVMAALDRWAGKTAIGYPEYGPAAVRRRQERHALWWLLTALRGPDSTGNGLKRDTTAYLRGRLLPRLTNVVAAVQCRTRPERWSCLLENLDNRVDRWTETFNRGHFTGHIEAAVKIIREHDGDAA